MRLEIESQGPSRCRTCESHVTLQFRRSYGDENDVAHRCTECDTYERLSNGSAAGKDVDLPDPITDPSRFNCGFEVPSTVSGGDGGEIDG